MPMEISADLINQLKVSLRKEANLSSFDPGGNYSIPSLPTSEEAIAELDASAPYLRCRNCKGKLLRGIESLICVFCGKQQRTIDNPPDPIKFTSTSAYKLFLSSLNLDGSEIVEPLKEINGSSRGAKASVAKGIAVSKFLDLEIQWSAIDDKSVNSGRDDGQSVQNKNSLNLGGINLDDYFVEGRGDLPRVELAESKPADDDDFKDPRSLSLFSNAKSQDVGESQQNEDVGLYKEKYPLKSENLSLFGGQDAQESVYSAEQGNFGFFDGKVAQQSFKVGDNLSLFEGEDTTTSSSSKKDEGFGFFEGEETQRTSSSKEHDSFGLFQGKEIQRNSSSQADENLDLFEVAPSSGAGLKPFDDKIVTSSSDCNYDSQSADHKLPQEKISGDLFANSSVDLAAQMDSVFGSGEDVLYAKPADSSTAYVSKGGDWLQDDFLGNVNGKTQSDDLAVHDKHEGQVVDGNASSSMDIDWIGDDLWQTSEKKPNEKTPMNDNDDDDDWNDFASSGNSKTPNNPLSQTLESSQNETCDEHIKIKEQCVDEKQNIGTSVMFNIGKGQEDDLFGTWDSSTSSAIPQTSLQSPTNHVNPSSEINREMNLFGADNNHRDLDFDNISHSDFFSESSSGKTKSGEVKAEPSETSTLERTSVPDDSKDQTVDLVEGTSIIAPKSKSDVAEKLMAQMHDLSFMLEKKLSVPPVSKTE